MWQALTAFNAAVAAKRARQQESAAQPGTNIGPTDAPIPVRGNRFTRGLARAGRAVADRVPGGGLPGGQIAVAVFVLLFLLLVLIPAGPDGSSRLHLLFMAITGRARLGSAATPAAAITTTGTGSGLLASDFIGGPIGGGARIL